ncbi:metal-dependent hydrolase [Aureibacter tunicatorum]|uniref:Uncharacterized protein n=1 Tax=Aureibacter tunicatorum TaxID=866807 RepID=A0AAE4BQ80_9BACT|nr:metal-dependent hydrolase [Aureibacter tunicatorum]MDR6237281.1 hypothetical protein [Aureibacter tunicatorum]BDD06272.1 hypothetical protein AUTU_37550 [Aureibacter tunicatorum]
MAGFTGHSIAGGVAGVAASIASVELLKLNINEAIIIGLLFYLGSLSPDIDANKAIITRKFFKYFGLLSGVICSIILFKKVEYYHVVVIIGGSWALSVYVIKPIFNQYTKHRGLFHSIPAGMVISGLFGHLILWLNNYRRELKISKFDDEFVKFAALAFLLGYILHLIIDEIWSLKGMKSSLGTALKVYEQKKAPSYILMYLIAMGLYATILPIKWKKLLFISGF